MKNHSIIYLHFLIICIISSKFLLVTTYDFVRGEEVLENITCKVYKSSMKLELPSRKRIHYWLCDTIVEYEQGNPQKVWFHLEGLNDTFIATNYDILTSGESEIHLDRVIRISNSTTIVVQLDTNVTLLGYDNEFENKNNESSRTLSNNVDYQYYTEKGINYKKKSIGVQTLLIAKVETTMGEGFRHLTEDQMHAALFGENEGSLNSQFKACSYNKLSFVKAVGTHIDDKGVTIVTLPNFIFGKNGLDILNAVRAELEQRFDNNLEQFDHIAIFVPFGSYFGKRWQIFWGAYSMMNGRITIYNASTGAFLSSLMHEIGHNFGLFHASEGDDELGDRTGYMGESEEKELGPIKCFNAVHSWRLGWYEDRHITIDTTVKEGVAWSGILFGIDDYTVNDGDKIPKVATILKMDTSDTKSYYVMYNTNKGINRETMAHHNEVMVLESSGQRSKVVAGITGLTELRLQKYNQLGTLVMRICKQIPLLSVNVIVFLDSSPDQVWHDSRGNEYSCEWYAEVETRCEEDGNKYINHGMVAMEVCCYCAENFGIFTTIS